MSDKVKVDKALWLTIVKLISEEAEKIESQQLRQQDSDLQREQTCMAVVPYVPAIPHAVDDMTAPNDSLSVAALMLVNYIRAKHVTMMQCECKNKL